MTVEGKTNEYKPNSNISLIVKTEVNSFVSVMAIDQKIAFSDTHDIDAAGLKKAFLKGQGSANAEIYENKVFILTPNVKCSEAEKLLLTKEITKTVKQSTQQEALDNQVDYDDGNSDTDESESDLEQVTLTSNLIEENEEDEATFRKYFPDVWIYDNFMANTSTIPLQKQLPDSITTWKLSAFALHPEHGLSIAEPQFLMTSKKIYLEVNAPKIVRLGEIFEISVIPMSQDLLRQYGNMQVSLNGDFKFVTSFPNNDKCFRTSDYSTPLNLALRNKGKFLIQMMAEGRQSINVTATNQNKVVDVVELTIKVLPDGLYEQKIIEIFIDHSNVTVTTETISIEVPNGAKLMRASISLHRNPLGPALENFKERYINLFH